MYAFRRLARIPRDVLNVFSIQNITRDIFFPTDHRQAGHTARDMLPAQIDEDGVNESKVQHGYDAAVCTPGWSTTPHFTMQHAPRGNLNCQRRPDIGGNEAKRVGNRATC